MTRQEGFSTFKKFRFSESIVPSYRAKPIPVNELLRRFKSLYGKLCELNQNEIDKSSLKKISRDLISENLLNHKDPLIKAYVACCISELLRLFAPDFAYSQEEYQDIFEFFITQFKGLANNSSPAYTQNCALIESIAEVQSFVIVTELPNYNEIIVEVFKLFFDLGKKSLPQKVLISITTILIQLLHESPSISQQIVKIILSQFIKNDSLVSKVKQDKSITRIDEIFSQKLSYSIAANICNSCPEKLAPHVCQYFTDILDNFSLGSNPDSDSDSDSNIDMNTIIKAHSLIIQIWIVAPEILQMVIPILNEELLSDNSELRALAAKTVGEILAVFSAKVNFTVVFESCWQSWLTRANDKSPTVRYNWTKSCENILLYRPDRLKNVSEEFILRIYDYDDKVRLVACSIVGKLSIESIFSKFGSSLMLKALATCIKDKKQDIRVVSINTLANLYSLAYEKIAAGNSQYIELFDWIPSTIFEAYYLNSKEVTPYLDIAIYENIITFNDDSQKRGERILYIMQRLSPKALKAFNAIIQRQQQLSGIMIQFLSLCEKRVNQNTLKSFSSLDENDDESKTEDDTRLETIFNWLSNLFQNNHEAKTTLESCLPNFDRRSCKLFKECMQLSTPFANIRAALKELLKRVGNSQIIKLLFYRSSMLIFNISDIETIIKISTKSQDKFFNTSLNVLKDISINNPILLSTQNEFLKEAIKNKDKYPSKTITLFLRLYSKLIKIDKEEDQDEVFINKLLLITEENDFLKAKYASTIILKSYKNENEYVTKLLNFSTLLNSNDTLLDSRLAVLVQVAKFKISLFETKVDGITDFLVEDILLQDLNKDSELLPETTVLSDEGLPDGCMSKVLALRILCNRLRYIPPQEAILDLAVPILHLLKNIIVNDGEVKEGLNSPIQCKLRLKIESALLLLKLAKIQQYDKLIGPDIYFTLAYVSQDSHFVVREKFINKLKDYFSQDILFEKYAPILFLLAHEPEESFKTDISTWIRAKHRKQQITRNTVFERSICKFLQLLAHHPDYEMTTEFLIDISKFILFYLDLIASEDNLSLIFYLCQRVKQVEDAQLHSEELYAMSDLAQFHVRKFEQQNSWTLMTWPGKIALPSLFFKQLPNVEVAKEIAQRSFIPTSIFKEFEVEVKQLYKKKKEFEYKGTKVLKGSETNIQKPRITKKIKRKETAENKVRRTSKTRKISDENIMSKEESEKLNLRRSGRVKKTIQYNDSSSSEIDEFF